MANITTQTIRVDLSTDKMIPTAFTHQNDTARTLEFSIYNKGVPYTMTGNTVKFAYKSPIADGQYTVITGSGMASGTVGGNKVTVTLPSAYTAISGVGMLTMIITPTSGTVRPVNIRFVVQSSADGDDTIAGASDFPDAWMDEKVYSWLDDHIDGVFSEEQFTDAVGGWLDDHPEATTTVQDGSLTLVKFKNNEIPFVTPEQFGAKGDGTTDDTEAFESAIDDGRAIVCDGSYRITSQLILRSDLIIIGKDAEIKFDDISETFLVGGSNLSNVNIDGITFDFGDQTALKHSLSFLNSEKITLNGCEIKNGYGYSLRLNDSENIDIDSCYFHDITGSTGNPGGAIYGQNIVDMNVRNCRCEDIDDHFVYVAGVVDANFINVSNNVCIRNGSSGLTAGAAITFYANTHDCVASGNIITDCRSGIQISKYGSSEFVPSYIVCSNNVFDITTANGITIEGLEDSYVGHVQVTGNIFKNIGQDGIKVSYCYASDFSDNTFEGVVRHGIQMSYASRNVITGNVIRNATVTGILVGNDGICDDNVVANCIARNDTESGTGFYIRLGSNNKLSCCTARGFTSNIANAGTNTIIINETAVNGQWKKYCEKQSLTGQSVTYTPLTDGIVCASTKIDDTTRNCVMSVTDSTIQETIAYATAPAGIDRVTCTFPVKAGNTYTIVRTDYVNSLNMFFSSLVG